VLISEEYEHRFLCALPEDRDCVTRCCWIASRRCGLQVGQARAAVETISMMFESRVKLKLMRQSATKCDRGHRGGKNVGSVQYRIFAMHLFGKVSNFRTRVRMGGKGQKWTALGLGGRLRTSGFHGAPMGDQARA
jgi:hypothetical protein